MDIAISAATDFELTFLKKGLINSHHNIRFHVSGVGLLAATYAITELCHTTPDLIIQTGLAGTYRADLNLGECVIVEQEILGDTGAEHFDEHIDLFDMELLSKNNFPFQDKKLNNPYLQSEFKLPEKHIIGCTVCNSSGNETTAYKRKTKFNADIESMEGAALHYTCLIKQIPFVQFRGISNIAGQRDKSFWKISEAMYAFTDSICRFVSNIKTLQ
ncbi:MAG: hypothetical protein R2831_08940 [Chitinophagaceae bacterium]